MRNPYVLACGIAAGHGVHGPTVGDSKMFVYEFVGDLSRFDDPGLVSEDGEVLHHGYHATELLTRALLGYRSMSAEDQLEVENLLKRIFDPRGTVFDGRPFTDRWLEDAFNSGPGLIFTSFASGAAGEERLTKLILKFRNMAENDRSLVVLCMTYETLAPQADVRMT
jgi:hypothetical protein